MHASLMALQLGCTNAQRLWIVAKHTCVCWQLIVRIQHTRSLLKACVQRDTFLCFLLMKSHVSILANGVVLSSLILNINHVVLSRLHVWLSATLVLKVMATTFSVSTFVTRSTEQTKGKTVRAKKKEKIRLMTLHDTATLFWVCEIV